MTAGEYRVKVYLFDESSDQWLDTGTGLLTVQVNEKYNGLGISVKDEASIHTIFETKVNDEDGIYKREGEKIIAWRDTMLGDRQCAISFENAHEAEIIYIRLTTTTPKLLLPDLLSPKNPVSSVVEVESLSHETGRKVFRSIMSILFPMPVCKRIEESQRMRLMELVEEVLRSKNTVSDFNRYLELLIRRDISSSYEENILERLFLQSGQSSVQELKYLYERVFRKLVESNEPLLYEFLLQESIFPIVCSLYDHDFEKVGHKVSSHFELFKQTRFVNVLGVNDESILCKIKKNHRIRFLKDVLLNRILDEMPYGLLTNIEHINYTEILTLLNINSAFVGKLYTTIASTDDIDRIKGLNLLKQLLLHIRGLKKIQMCIFQDTIEHTKSTSLLAVLNTLLESDRLGTKDIYLLGEILKLSLEYNATDIRQVFLSQLESIQSPEDKPLLAKIVNIFLEEQDDSVSFLYSDILFILFDVSNLVDLSPYEQFITLFFKTLGVKLYQPLLSGKFEGPDSTKINILIRLLCFCIQSCSFSVKFFIVTNSILENAICQLKLCKSLSTKVAILKFVKSLVVSQDKLFYSAYIKKASILTAFFEFFEKLKNSNKQNMMYSLCLNIIYHILLTNNNVLICACSESNFIVEILKKTKEVGISEMFEKLNADQSTVSPESAQKKRKLGSAESHSITPPTVLSPRRTSPLRIDATKSATL